MEERKFVKLKKNELEIKDFVKRSLGKGRISNVLVEYTPVGEKIVVSTSKPGLIIGRKGEKITKLTEVLKKRFELENPHIEIDEIKNPKFDSQLVADEIALALERMGPLRFKVIAYRTLQDIMRNGALGAELKLSGKLPSERARTWRFSQGYLKKTGETSKIVDTAEAIANTFTGTIGVKVSILSPDAEIHDRIVVDEKLKQKMKLNIGEKK